jgi:hypothetical protein
MLEQLEVLEAVVAGKLNVAQAAQKLGKTEAEVSRQLEVLELAGALAKRQARVTQRRFNRIAAATAVVAGLTSMVWVVYPAWAAGACAQTLPLGMNTMCPNAPALASEVNTNFQLLANVIATKTGALDAGTGTTASSLTVNGTIRGKAAVATQGFELDWNRSVGSGSTDFVNFKDMGTGGFNFWNGATKIGELNSIGDMISTYGTHTYLNITNTATITTANITTVNGRRPIFVASNSCSSGSCTASCSPGVVKQGWGMHGVNGLNTNFDPQAGTCGKALTWLGSCIGAASCTVNTACSSSSITLDCW